MVNIETIKNLFKKSSEQIKNKSAYPTVIIEESFTLGGKEGSTFFKVSFEVPVPISKSANREEIDRVTKITDDTFRPIVVILTKYLKGLSTEDTERFLLGRENLIEALKQCANVQLKMINDAEKHR